MSRPTEAKAPGRRFEEAPSFGIDVSRAAEAVEAYAARELEIISGIERGIDDMRADRVIRHEDAMRDLRRTLHHKLHGK